MPDNATPLATRSANPLVQFREQIEQRSKELKMALPAHISPEKFQRTILTAAQQNPGLLRANRQSLVLACMKAAQDGLLPDGREAALVPFKTSKKVDGQWVTSEEVAYIPMTFGIRKKVLQARDADGKPVVGGLEVGVVYRKEVEAGHFLYEVGLEPPLRHRPMIDLTADDTTDDKIVGAYSIATMADRTKSYEFMRRFEIDKVREASQTGATRDRNGKPRESKGPWKDWFAEMCKKTVLKRHSKTLPQSGDLIIETDDDEFDAGASTAAVLGSTKEDEPRAIEDHTEDTPEHDPETGEIIDGDANVTGDDTSAERVNETAKAEPDKKPTHRRGRASTEGNAEPANASEKPVAGNDAAKAEGSAEPARDEQTGITKDPFEEKGDEYVERLSKAETIIDLDAVHAEFERESEGWPYEIVQGVEAEHKRHTRRLSPAKADLETAGAK